ncbi:hypothetical protein TIFTF001_004629 [Ficus carica]|uniref:Uncharacterized protein n=1 Tax=Ficus carica TaxID=3494 RepID=A0AA87ZI98_FICCA|nr:hypothetical protein TIFTF001_004629 [Ficus carica]
MAPTMSQAAAGLLSAVAAWRYLPARGLGGGRSPRTLNESLTSGRGGAISSCGRRTYIHLPREPNP